MCSEGHSGLGNYDEGQHSLRLMCYVCALWSCTCECLGRSSHVLSCVPWSCTCACLDRTWINIVDFGNPFLPWISILDFVDRFLPWIEILDFGDPFFSCPRSPRETHLHCVVLCCALWSSTCACLDRSSLVLSCALGLLHCWA